jgi:hypothetical protein
MKIEELSHTELIYSLETQAYLVSEENEPDERYNKLKAELLGRLEEGERAKKAMEKIKHSKRGLWDMVDWEKWGKTIDSYGIISLYDKKTGHIHIVFDWNSPELALLKAIAAQENIEVK